MLNYNIITRNISHDISFSNSDSKQHKNLIVALYITIIILKSKSKLLI